MTPVQQLLTVQQVAKMTGMTKEGVKYGVRSGKLKYAAMAAKSYLFTQAQVDEWRKAVKSAKMNGIRAANAVKGTTAPYVLQRIKTLEIKAGYMKTLLETLDTLEKKVNLMESWMQAEIASLKGKLQTDAPKDGEEITK
jgi:excisionase family DNA binding protein